MSQIGSKEDMKTQVIDSFFGYFRFLSNFFEAPVSLDGVVYPTVEHAFQAAKIDPRFAVLREPIRKAHTPGTAKALGRQALLRQRWDDMKVGVMLDLLRKKFNNPHRLGGRLLHTNDAELIEGNTWGDTYWGVCRGRGLNMLGKLLMQVRAELKEKT